MEPDAEGPASGRLKLAGRKEVGLLGACERAGQAGREAGDGVISPRRVWQHCRLDLGLTSLLLSLPLLLIDVPVST